MRNLRIGNGWPTKEQEHLLRACFLTGELALDAWQRWLGAIQRKKIDAGSYKLLALAAKNAALERMEDPIFQKAQRLYRQTWIANRIHWQKARTILDQIEKRAGKIVLLKGIAMILGYYQDFGVRVIGDLDILIPRSQARSILGFLKESGWISQLPRLNGSIPEQLDRWHAVNWIDQKGINLDLHWSFSLESFADFDQAVLDGALSLSLDGRIWHLPPPSDLFIQTCVHGVKHCRTPLIRWVADALTLLKRDENRIDWERLMAHAKRNHLSLSLFAAFSYLIETFQAPIPGFVLERLQGHPITALERREYRANTKGSKNRAAWHRFCLRYGYSGRKSFFLHLHRYIQISALLKSVWHIPFYGLYWIATRSARSLFRRICRWLGKEEILL